jgi:HD-like signal output (HDOD) protein
MPLSKDQTESMPGESTEISGFPPAPLTAAPLEASDPEARRTRKLALMATLSEGLPTLPAYVFELNTLLAAVPVDIKRVVDVILTDPSLAAQVLRLCNSAILGFRERVTRIEHAVVLIGTERLRTLVLTCSLLEYVGHRVPSEDVQSFWQHCFLTAALSERLARGIAYGQPAQAYLGGLLHDIGALPLLVVTAAEAGKLETLSSCGWGESVALEQEHFGTDHCEVGHWMGVSWNFPSALREVIVGHHSPSAAKHDPRLVGVVAAADQFCVGRGIVLGFPPADLADPGSDRIRDVLQACLPHLTPEEASSLAERLEGDFLSLIQLMEFGAAGLFGGGIPKNPFRENEGQT